jgi:hypothetical protein
MKYIFVLFICLGPAWLFANKDSLNFAVEISTDYSHTGAGAEAGLILLKHRNQFCLRVKTSLTYLTNKDEFPYGFGVGYRLVFIQKKHFRSYAEIAYENFFLKLYSYTSSNTQLYQAHEIYGGYGTGLCYGHFVISNSISYGGYAELRTEQNEDEREFFYHLSPQIKINIAYEF